MKAPKTLLARTLKSFARTEPPKKVKRRKRKIGGGLVLAPKAPERSRGGRPRTTPPRPMPKTERRGENHPTAKLSDKDRVRIIRLYDAQGATQAELASKYSVTQSAISHIVRNQRWVLGA